MADTKILTGKQTEGMGTKIHYYTIDAFTAFCGASGPFDQTTITWSNRINNEVCKTCFQRFVKLQTPKTE